MEAEWNLTHILSFLINLCYLVFEAIQWIFEEEPSIDRNKFFDSFSQGCGVGVRVPGVGRFWSWGVGVGVKLFKNWGVGVELLKIEESESDFFPSDSAALLEIMYGKISQKTYLPLHFSTDFNKKGLKWKKKSISKISPAGFLTFYLVFPKLDFELSKMMPWNNLCWKFPKKLNSPSFLNRFQQTRSQMKEEVNI